MVYGYARVSTKGQARDGNSLESQEQALRDAGALIIYKDAFTGTKTERPEFNKLLSELKPNDTIVVTKLDRVARSASHGMELIQGLIDRNIKVHVLNIGTMDNSPTGRLIRNVMLAFAEFERDMIVERTQEGKIIARDKEGFVDGRPMKYSRAQMEHALRLLNEHSYKQVEAMTGISKSTLIRAKRRKQ